MIFCSTHTRNKCGMDIGVILSVFLSVCAWQAYGQEEQTLGNLTFVCQEGWRMYQSDCYMRVDVMMTWDDAKSTCQRQGGDLLWIVNEIEYDFVRTDVATGGMFWSGLQRESGIATWSHMSGSIELKDIAVWANNEPNTDGSNASCAVSQDEGLGLKSCSLKLPFVCKYQACLKGYMPCATGGGCFSHNEKCDGVNDCSDRSDERDCRQSGCTECCSYYYKLTGTSGNFQTARIDDGTYCSYVLEAPIGKRIRLNVPSTTLDEDAASLEIWTGSPDLQHSKRVARLTGSFAQNYYFSMNNFITVLLVTGNMPTSARPAIAISYALDINEIFDDVRTVSATGSWMPLLPTFSKEETPMELKLSWKIEAPEGEVIMYYLDSYVQSEGASLTVQEGAMADDPVRTMDPASVNRVYYGSAASTLQVHWNSGEGMSTFNLQYKTGCYMEIDEAVGEFSVPIFRKSSQSYPSDLTCVWVLTGGKDRGRGLAVTFTQIELGEDPRATQYSQDKIKLYMNESTDSAEIGNAQTGLEYHDDSGHIKVEFLSDLILNDGVGFDAKFSVDCPLLNVSDWTVKSDESLTYETDVVFSCQAGYKFDAQEYYSMSEVILHCMEGGVWTYNGKTDIRVPNCEVVQCGIPGEIQNGYIKNVSSTSFEGTAYYECNDFFGISYPNEPDTRVYCDASGSWQNVPLCGSATCVASQIQGISHGTYMVEAGNEITSGSVDFATVVKFSCDPGYELVGSLRSHCRNEGWSDQRPTCQIIRCPKLMRDNAGASADPLYYGQSNVISCLAGYSINGTVNQTSVTVTCDSDRNLTPYFECEDINECETVNGCDPASTECSNTDGDYDCLCRDGYQNTGSTSCSDIRECDTNNGGCSHTCQELPGSYQCTCPMGWTLFTEDGIQQHNIPALENGYRYGDVYYYNHTCVRNACARPQDIDHGTLLSTKTLFRYEDTVDLVCDDGYHLTGYSQTTTRLTRNCLSTGWNIETITCSARTCSTSTPPNRGTYDKTTVPFGEKVTLTCQWTATETRTRTAVCIYEGGTTRLAGDDITSCPEIDCGDPANSLPSGGRVVSRTTNSNKHMDNGAFTFGCEAGFTLEGVSESNDTTVRCKENGRWSLGTLDCAGPKCSDPGTPAEAEQVVDNYEVGKTLYFTCKRDGYVPVPNMNYTCQYNSFTDSTSWSNNLAGNFPACLDQTAPEISNLPTEPVVYRDRMEMANVNAPVFQDNFAVKQTEASQSIQSTDIIADSMIVTYTATDFDGNEQTAAVNIQVIDRTVKPNLNCPPNWELSVTNISPETYDITQHVTSDGTVTFSQEMVTVSVSNIGTYVRIDVTAKNEFDTEAFCSFLVTFKAGVCFESTLYPDSNAIRDCTASGDGFVCSSVCRSGYIYGDGTAEKQFTCTGQNVWNVNYPHVFCLPVQSPAYQFDATVIHDYNFLSGPCLSDYQTRIQSSLTQFESRMTAQQECAGVQWDISSHTAGIGAASTQFKTDFTVATTAISEAAQTSCIQAIKDNNEVVFNIGSTLSCQSQGRSYDISISNFTSTDGSFGCNTPTYVLIESAAGKKCVPCGPGQYYYAAGDLCTSCPAGQYQDQLDGTCRECNTGQTPNAEQTKCIITCPAGFTSADGLLPCTPCAVNSYWSDARTCTPCNSGTSTSGREGVGAMGGCFSSCSAGQYSLTGYNDVTCRPCPRNFYQPNEGSTTCLECQVNQVTDNTGETELASCHDYTFSGGESCNNAYCNNHGTCGFQFHRPVCTCDGGYRGDRCQTEFHICDSSPYNPCMNGAACVRGSTFDDFTCECTEVLNIDSCFTQSFVNKDGGNQNQIQPYYYGQSLANCQTQCLETEDCESLTYYSVNDPTICVLYSVTLTVGELLDQPGRTYYNRNCPPVYGGPKCENDLLNECDSTNNQCSSAAMCKDKVLDYECLCPTIGGYHGQYCEQTQQPCDSFPCQHGGSCVNFGNIRYECTCVLGYTGVNCETNIDDCAIHSDACSYGGNCTDRVDGYTCLCPTSFSGDNCEVTPNYCTFTNCLGNPCYNNLDGRTSMCECEPPYFENSGLGGNRCTATGAHECDFVSCVNGTCNNQGNCVCEGGFTGSLCQHSIDDCTASSCVNGDCVDMHQGVKCDCHTGFEGDRCETNIDDCANQCGANGRCDDGIDGFTCVCNSGYTGSNCETEINECLAYPCLHDGTCTDLVGSYSCSCPAGWTGNNCESWNDFCSPNPCRNDGECYNLKQDLICRCGGGTQGQFCDDRRSVCDTVQLVNVCINGGECQDTGGTAECQCPIVPDMDRCFTTVHTDKEGGSEGMISQTFVDEQSCKQTCLGRNDCKSLSYFTIGNSRACQIYSVTLPTTLTDRPGALHFVKECPSDYAGKACELAKDWCAGSPCQHGGTCTALEPRGFHCNCETGYSGTTCEIAANPCSGNPCPSDAICRHSETEYYCQCQMGREVTGGLCRSDTSGAGYVILVADAEDAGVLRRKRASHGGSTPSPLSEDLPTLRSPFRMSGGTLSVMLWVRIHNPLEDYTYEILKLVGSEMLFPWRDGDPKLIVLITNKNAVVTYNHESVTLVFDPPLERAEWYHIGVSLTADRQVSYTINAVEVSDQQTLPGTAALEFDSLNAQIVLGDVDMVVEYKRVTVWETALSNSEFAQAYASEVYTPQGIITQGWWNYLLTKSARLLTQELSQVLYSVDRSLPTLTCDSMPYEKVSNERVLRRSSLMDFTSRINGIYANGDELSHSIPEDLTWGYYSAVVILEANNRYTECRFPVYIKYNNVCPAPVDDSDVTITPCDAGGNDGVCGLQCINSASHYVSAATPEYRPCGVLGVYYWDAPHMDLVLPTCSVVSPQKFVVNIAMQYEFSIDCTLIDINDIKDGIKDKFVELNSRWTSICMDGSACTNLKFTKSDCSSAMTKRLDLGFSLNFQQERLYARDMAGNADGDMRLDDALKSIIVLQKLIDISRFASAQLVASSVVVTMTSDCTTPGYNLIGDMCVPCGKGLRYNSAQKQCDFCPMGTYKDMNDVECMPCGVEKTTVNWGTTTFSKCINYCNTGRFYNDTRGLCQNCPRHYYQDKKGQSFCHPCAVGYKTQAEASELASDCKEDCQAGFGRNVTGYCVMCKRGYWRDLIEDDCQQCDSPRTTIPGVIAKSRDMCEMDICGTGTFWNTASEQCTDCPLGQFQDQEAMLECTTCDGNKTTKNPKADSADLCTFYCAAGYEVNENETNACLPCKRGYYKDNEGNSKFETCKQCVGKTTDNIASESEDLCEYDICPRGYYLVNKGCIQCDVDYYQPMMMPDSSVLCTQCPDIQGTPQGTEGDAREYETDCKPICPGGQQFNITNTMCVDCDVGTYKPGDDRFGECRKCPTNFTTDGKKKTAETDCDIPLCAKGDYVLDKVCTVCETNSYQPDSYPAAGVTCTPCPNTSGGVETGTRDTGADSENKCEPVCPGGYEYNGDIDQCVKCPIGKYKPETASDRFESCYNCTEGFINAEEGMTSVDSCTIRNCPPGSFDDDTKCELCFYGFFQAEWTQKDCDQCGENLNTSRRGASSSDECQAFCGPGKQTTISQTCVPCPEGKYKTAASYEPCMDCPTDFTSNEDRTQCNILFCSAGKENKTLAQGIDCVPCEVGKFKANPGNTACETCPAGKTTNETQQTSCEILHCEPGKYRVGSACVECATGYYKSEAGNEGCTMCPTGKTTAGQGTTREDDCNIVMCGIGYYREPTQTTNCTECPLNKYQHIDGQTFCNNCPMRKVTMQTASTNFTDCVDECQKGQEYKNGACEACLQRYYKNTVGNFLPCSECPSETTTVGTGSTDISQCNQTDCDPGTYVKVENGIVLCPKCAKGQYQPERSKTECISCGANYITVNEGSVLESQCHVRCPAGQGLRLPDTTTCVPCPLGQYKSLPSVNPNRCVRCPPGFTNSAEGKSTCTVPVVEPSPPVVIVTLVATLIFGVETDCSQVSLSTILLNIQKTIRTGMNNRRGRYTGLCGINQSTCNNIFCTLPDEGCHRRGKRELTHNVEVIVTMPNVTDTVVDTDDDDRVFDTRNVVAEIFETNPADFTPLVGSIEYGSLTAPLNVTPVCEAGYYIDGPGCSPCATGQYWNSASATCLNCRTDEYQDEEAQTECKPCPENTYNDITAAKALSACKSFCAENTDYCNNRGNCRDTGRRTAECICNADFSGDRCETKQTPKSNNDAIIGGTVGGIAGLLVLILIVVGIYRWKFAGAEKKRHKKSSRHSHHSYEEEYFRNPIYDNRNGAGYYTPQGTVAANMPAVFTSLPEAEYYAGNDPYALYSQSSKHKHHSRDHSETRQGGHPGGSEYIWQA